MSDKGISHLVYCKTLADVEPAKKFVLENGATEVGDTIITMKGFEAFFPKDSVSTLKSSPHIAGVEFGDNQVSTQ